MSDVTVAQFAEVLKVPVERLLVQLDEAGISVSGADAVISDDAKMELLTHLRKSHGHAEENSTGGAPKKITLKRRTQSEIRLASNQGRARTVNVEIRRKRTYVKRDELEKEARQQQEEVDRKRREEEESRLEKERLERAEQERVEQERRERELREQEAARLKAEEEAKAAEEARRQKEARKRETGERERATEDIRSWTKVAAEPERAPVDDK